MNLHLSQNEPCPRGDKCCGRCQKLADERRAEPRVPSAAVVKVFDRRSRRYYPGRAVNLSPRGALIELSAPRPFALGQALDLFVAVDHPTVAPASAFRSAVVVRLEDNRLALRVEPAAPAARVRTAA